MNDSQAGRRVVGIALFGVVLITVSAGLGVLFWVLTR